MPNGFNLFAMASPILPNPRKPMLFPTKDSPRPLIIIKVMKLIIYRFYSNLNNSVEGVHFPSETLFASLTTLRRQSRTRTTPISATLSVKTSGVLPSTIPLEASCDVSTWLYPALTLATQRRLSPAASSSSESTLSNEVQRSTS